MPKPHVFFGQRGDGHLLELDADTFVDHAAYSYNLYAKTNRYAPAGAGGEAIFPSLKTVITYEAAVSVYYTPIIDGVALATQKIVLAAPGAKKTIVREIGLSVPVFLADGVTEVGRVYPRGVWIQVLVETRNDNAVRFGSRVVIEQVACEFEVVEESQLSAGVPA